MNEPATDQGASSPASAFARYSSTRARVRRTRRALTWVTAGAAACCGIAWTQLVRLEWNAGLIIVPLLVFATAVAPFVRHGRKAAVAAVVVRASLWGSFLCGTAAALGGNAGGIGDAGAAVAFPAGVGLLSLGRFSRSLAGARPVLIALVCFAVADAVIDALIATFMLAEGRVEERALLFGLAAAANVVGLVCLLRLRIVWPHIVGNVGIALLAVTDAFDVKPVVNVTLAGAALLQVVLAALVRLPPASRRTRRNVERALRLAIVAVVAADVVSAIVR